MENTDTDKQTGVELLRAVYEQHWLHARHAENERLWFTNIFSVIVAGLLGFIGTMGGTDLAPATILAGSFVSLLSVIGYFFCLTWRAAFVEHTTLAIRILEDSLLPRYAPYVSDAYKVLKLGWKVNAHKLFLLFYAVMAGLGVATALGIGVDSRLWWAGFGPFLLLILLWVFVFSKKETLYRQMMSEHSTSK